MTLYISIATLLSLIYLGIVMRYWEGWTSLPVYQADKKERQTAVSVLIPARNEEDNIAACLQAILAQHYPAECLEIIVIDDHSTDQTALEVHAFNQANIHLISLAEHIEPGSTQSFKKKAIEIAVQKAKGELIITTDADCKMGKDWLHILVSYYEEYQPVFIAAPVIFYDEQNVFQRFQSLDFISMMGVTGAGIYRNFQHLCNGANLAYAKTAFHQVNGFEGIDQLASGDDLMLIQKMAKQFPDRIGFIKNPAAATFTTPKRTIRSFMSQRIRWATKTTHYPDFRVTLTWALIWFFCISIPFSFLLIIFWGMPLLWLAIGQLFFKILIDYIFLSKVAGDLDRKDLVSMGVYIPSIILELLYIIVIGTLGNLVKNYEWKGRKVK